MNDDETRSIWAELRKLSDEMAELKLRKEVLIDHVGQLEEMHASLTIEANKAQALADRVREIL